jgi:DNA-binding transcriptional LysR family regulator
MLRGLKTSSIRLAAVESAALSFLWRFIADFGRRYPGLHLNISVPPSADVIARVID